MTEADFGTFERAFKRVSGAFRLKLKAEEMTELMRTYYRVLEPFTLEDVLASAKTCVGSCRQFPKPVEWLAALPNRAMAASQPADRRTMGAFELEEHSRAERLRYQDQPCLCSECCRAGIDNEPLRFVPTLFGEDEERAFNARRNEVQVMGHWAHGDELKRWYQARSAFFALAPRALARVFIRPEMASDAREPGQEG